MRTSKIQLHDYLVQINHIARPSGNEMRTSNVEAEAISAIEVYKWFVEKKKEPSTVLSTG